MATSSWSETYAGQDIRSKQSIEFEAALQAMLDRLDDPEVAGVWLDRTDARRDPLWLPTAAGEGRDTTAADRW